MALIIITGILADREYREMRGLTTIAIIGRIKGYL